MVLRRPNERNERVLLGTVTSDEADAESDKDGGKGKGRREGREWEKTK